MGLRRRLVKSLLRRYVQDIQDRHIHVDVSRGCVRIDDAVLETAPLAELFSGVMPFGWEVIQAQATEIQLDLPWKHLRTRSTAVTVGEIAIVLAVHPCAACGLSAKPCPHWHNALRQQLSEMCEAHAAAKQGPCEKLNLTQIVTNGLQVSLEKVTVRLEPCSVSQHCCSGSTRLITSLPKSICLNDVFWGPVNPDLQRLTRFVASDAVAMTTRDLHIGALSLKVAHGPLLVPTPLTLRIHSLAPSDGRSMCPFDIGKRIELELQAVCIDGTEEQVHSLLATLVDVMDSGEFFNRQLGRKPWSEAEHEAIRESHLSTSVSLPSTARSSVNLLKDSNHSAPASLPSSARSSASAAQSSNLSTCSTCSSAIVGSSVVSADTSQAWRAEASTAADDPFLLESMSFSPDMNLDDSDAKATSNSKLLKRFLPSKRQGKRAVTTVAKVFVAPASIAARGMRLTRRAQTVQCDPLNRGPGDDNGDMAEAADLSNARSTISENMSSVDSSEIDPQHPEHDAAGKLLPKFRSDLDDRRNDGDEDSDDLGSETTDNLDEYDAPFYTPAHAQSDNTAQFGDLVNQSPSEAGNDYLEAINDNRNSDASAEDRHAAQRLPKGVSRQLMLTVHIPTIGFNVHLPRNNLDIPAGRVEASLSGLTYRLSRNAWQIEAEQACASRLGGPYAAALALPPSERGAASEDGVIASDHEATVASCNAAFIELDIDGSGRVRRTQLLETGSKKNELISARWRSASGEPCRSKIRDSADIYIWPFEAIVQGIWITHVPKYWLRIRSLVEPAITAGVNWDQASSATHCLSSISVLSETRLKLKQNHAQSARRIKSILLRDIAVKQAPSNSSMHNRDLPHQFKIHSATFENVSMELSKISSIFGLTNADPYHHDDVDDMAPEQLRAELRMWRQKGSS